ncbi:MAG: hypothetical protein EP338_04720 [Bacteroidetes bacterium]|nr:MAG: hypothetical protein EP338_04720 [Bacteroidota bacterium]
MKTILFSGILLLTTGLYAQNKGNLSIYWGWNHSNYSRSNISFQGIDYDFTLQKVRSHDRQSAFRADTYFNPTQMTIPQYNFRVGYFLTDNWQLSIGMDHMKYVVSQYQSVAIEGKINDPASICQGDFNGEEIVLRPEFLLLEHTDGLNYGNIECRYFHPLINKEKLEVHALGGGGVGMLVPRTNATLFNQERYDEFHLAGYGLGVVTGLEFRFFKHFFIQSEAKGGFIHMPDIRTTASKSDRAAQHFFFFQYNAVFGFSFHLKSKEEKEVN